MLNFLLNPSLIIFLKKNIRLWDPQLLWPFKGVTNFVPFVLFLIHAVRNTPDL